MSARARVLNWYRPMRRRYRELGAKGFARWFLLKRVGKPIVDGLDRHMLRQSKVGTEPVLANELFPWAASFENEWKAVRRELDAILEYREHLPPLHSLQPDQKNISYDDKWRTFVISGWGHRSDRNCRRCPETARLLSQVPDVITAFYSIMAPGTHVPRHRGITRGVVRCHLGLIVPPREMGRCEIQVDEQCYRWEEGRLFLFDDVYKHEVWNETDQERVVLVFDIVRPMGWSGRLAHRLVLGLMRLSPFVRAARRNEEAWEDRVEGVIPAS